MHHKKSTSHVDVNDYQGGMAEKPVGHCELAWLLHLTATIA